MPVQEQLTPRPRESTVPRDSTVEPDHGVWAYVASPTNETPSPTTVPFTLTQPKGEEREVQGSMLLRREPSMSDTRRVTSPCPTPRPSRSRSPLPSHSKPKSKSPHPSRSKSPYHSPLPYRSPEPSSMPIPIAWEGSRNENQYKHPRKYSSSLNVRDPLHELWEVKALLRSTQDKIWDETRRADLADARSSLSQDRLSEVQARVLVTDGARREAEAEIHLHKALVQTRNEEITRLEQRVKEVEAREATSRTKAHDAKLALTQAEQHHKGYVEGHQSGMRIRIQKERKIAFDQGHDQGYEEGREHGYNEGRQHGHVEGKKMGEQVAKKDALKAFDNFLKSETVKSETVGSREGKSDARTRRWAESVYYHDLESIHDGTQYTQAMSEAE